MDERNLCPSGWHIPTDCEWMYLEGILGMSVLDQQIIGWRGSQTSGAMKSTQYWTPPNVGATNSSGFSALPGAEMYGSGDYFSVIGNGGYWWSSSSSSDGRGLFRLLAFNFNQVYRDAHSKSYAKSIRCLKDSEAPVLQGCTDGSACNFLANATQDDGSCLYPNATCDDGNVNTVNDVINGECVCGGTVIVNGCTDPNANNYNSLANADDNSCLYNYSVGSFGPAGGIIFYDKGQYSDGWRFLETYPNDVVSVWGCQGSVINGTQTVLGSGYQNTMIIAPSCGGIHSLALGLDLNGFTDWFIPSKDELSLIYGNRNYIPGLQYNGGPSYYMSSSEYNSNGAWTMYMANGSWSGSPKNTNHSFRPIRRF
jgi:uncharacterized protein (TIGR02145 family)